MANKKINDLAAAGSVIGTMQFETDIGGSTANKVTATQVRNFINANGALDLTSSEVAQLANIDTTTISTGQWVYLGAMDQSIATTDSPTFVGATLSGLSNGILKSTAGVLSGGNSVTLTSEVSGILPIANGGTNSNTVLNNDRVMISSSGSIVESSTITTTELSLLNGIVSVSTGTSDNDKFVTQGYVDDAIIPGLNVWNRVTGTPNYVIPTTTSDDIGATGAKITKGWFTALEAGGLTFAGGNISGTGIIGFNQPINQTLSATGLFHTYIDGTNTFGFYSSNGTPEGSLAAPVGSLCSDATNGNYYIKKTGVGVTGWSQVDTGALSTYWKKIGTTLSPLTAGDDISTTGDIIGQNFKTVAGSFTDFENPNSLSPYWRFKGSSGNVGIIRNNYNDAFYLESSIENMQFNVPTGKNFQWSVNNIDGMTFDNTTGLKVGDLIIGASATATKITNTGTQFINIVPTNGNLSIGDGAAAYRLVFDRSASGEFINVDDGTDTFGIFNNAGSPEGIIATDIGSLCIDTTNGEIYIKTTDTVNTGWVKLDRGSTATWGSIAGTLSNQTDLQNALDAKQNMALASVPATPTSTGTTGQEAYGSGYMYKCVATNTWVRHVVATSW